MGEVNLTPSAVVARVLVDALVRCGVTDAVLAPGSRSAALALALAAAERAGDLTLHVRVDERSAGYLALGLAKRSRRAVPVFVTSGTAVAELLPAMVEASFSGVPLIAVTADRPVELLKTGANQTIDHVGIFGSSTRMAADLPAPEQVGDRALRVVQSVISRAVAAACDPFDPGPAHINVSFRDPLVPGYDEQPGGVELAVLSEPSITVDARLTAAMVLPIDEAGIGPIPARGVVVVGDPIDDESREAAAELAEACGWPLICEPSGLPAVDSDALIAHASLLLADAEFRARMRPDLVVSVGRVGLSRGTMRLIASADRHVVVDPRPAVRWADPLRTARFVLSAVPEPPTELEADAEWLQSWRAASDAAEEAVSAVLDDEVTLHAPAVARLVMAQADALGVVLVGSSWPVRHVEAYALPRDHMPLVVGNRGTSGIDGLLATAWGIAVSHQRDVPSTAYALVGDLSFLYDINGLLAGKGEPRPNLVIVVIDNDGGGIFSSLEQGDTRFAPDFERVFGTPHGLDLVAIAQAHGVPARRVTSPHELVAAIDDAVATGGVGVIVATTGARSDEAGVVRRVQELVSEAIRTGGH